MALQDWESHIAIGKRNNALGFIVIFTPPIARLIVVIASRSYDSQVRRKATQQNRIYTLEGLGHLHLKFFFVAQGVASSVFMYCASREQTNRGIWVLLIRECGYMERYNAACSSEPPVQVAKFLVSTAEIVWMMRDTLQLITVLHPNTTMWKPLIK